MVFNSLSLLRKETEKTRDVFADNRSGLGTVLLRAIWQIYALNDLNNLLPELSLAFAETMLHLLKQKLRSDLPSLCIYLHLLNQGYDLVL